MLNITVVLGQSMHKCLRAAQTDTHNNVLLQAFLSSVGFKLRTQDHGDSTSAAPKQPPPRQPSSHKVAPTHAVLAGFVALLLL